MKPHTAGRSSNLTDGELNRLRTEQGLAHLSGLTWQERGPVATPEVTYWRGQHLRSGQQGGKVRYAKRGGKRREVYAELARKGMLKPTPGGTVSKSRGSS